MADMGIKRDVPIVLNSISYEDNYRGDFAERRAIIYTLTFTAKFYLYGSLSHLIRLSKLYRLTNTLIFQKDHLQENRDIQFHRHQSLPMQMMILDLMKPFHSLKMLKHLIQKQERTLNYEL